MPKEFLKFIVLGFSISFLPVLFSTLAFSKVGFLISAAICLIFVLGLIFQSEKGLLRFLTLKDTLPPGLERSLQYATEDLEICTPQLVIHTSALPSVYLWRSPRSAGTISLSQGLLACLSENELRAILRLTSLRALAHDLPSQTLSLFLSQTLNLQKSSKPLTPFRFLFLLILLPCLRGLAPNLPDALSPIPLGEPWNTHLRSALLKITKPKLTHSTTSFLGVALTKES